MKLEDFEKIVNPFKSAECKSVFLTPQKKLLPPPPPPASPKENEKELSNHKKTDCDGGTSTTKDWVQVAGLSRLTGSSTDLPELPHVCGFDLGYQAECVTNAMKLGGRVLLLIKWKGRKEPELVPSDIARWKCPQLLIQYYQKRLTWNNDQECESNIPLHLSRVNN